MKVELPIKRKVSAVASITGVSNGRSYSVNPQPPVPPLSYKVFVGVQTVLGVQREFLWTPALGLVDLGLPPSPRSGFLL